MPLIPGLNLCFRQLTLTHLNIALIHLGALATSKGIIKGLETKQLSEELRFILQKLAQFHCIYFDRTQSSYMRQSSVGILDIFALYEAKLKGDIPDLFKETSAINLKCDICSGSNLLLPDESITTRYNEDNGRCGNSKWKDRDVCFVIKDKVSAWMALWRTMWTQSSACERSDEELIFLPKKLLMLSGFMLWPTLPCHWDTLVSIFGGGDTCWRNRISTALCSSLEGN